VTIRIFKQRFAVLTACLIAVGVTTSQAPIPVSGAALTTGVSWSLTGGDDPAEPGCPPFFGLDPPGPNPEPFAPERFVQSDTRLHGAAVFSPDGDRVCWSVVPPAILCAQCENGTWSVSRVLPLPGMAVQAPAFSADGSRLYYQAIGPGGLGSLDIWWVDAERGDWTTTVNIGPPVNGPGAEGQPTFDGDGDLFFTGSMEGVQFGRGIYLAARTKDGYSPPQALGEVINTPGIDYCPFVSADGKTLLFASNRGHAGEELYIHVAFRTPDGGWTEPVDLHPIMNHPQTACFPSISPDGRFLFFLSEGRIWWVDSAVIDMRGGP
jgi:hypothetical protein